MYKIILFDLDGTITDSIEGISNSFIYALKHFGIEEKKENLKRVVGPPLKNSFMEFYGFDGEKANQAVKIYREYYQEKGIFENSVYVGLGKLLEELYNSGKTLMVATAKPTVYAKRIVEYFGLDEFFKGVIGTEQDGSITEKEEVIRLCLEVLGEKPSKQILMIGDRKHDIIAANKIGISSMAVLYGYGSYEELIDEKPTHIVETPEEIKNLIVKSEFFS